MYFYSIIVLVCIYYQELLWLQRGRTRSGDWRNTVCSWGAVPVWHHAVLWFQHFIFKTDGKIITFGCRILSYSYLLATGRQNPRFSKIISWSEINKYMTTCKSWFYNILAYAYTYFVLQCLVTYKIWVSRTSNILIPILFTASHWPCTFFVQLFLYCN